MSKDETIDPEFRSRFKLEPPPSAFLAFMSGAAGGVGAAGNSRKLRLLQTLSPNPLYYIKKIEVLILDFPKT